MREQDRPILMLVCGAGGAGVGAGWVEAVVRAWPEPRPIVRRVALETFVDRGFVVDERCVIVLWHDGSDRAALMCQAMDRIAGESLAAVVLSGEPERLDVQAGVLVRARNADASALSLVLRGLWERQGAVMDLKVDRLALMHTQAGLAHRMEQMQEELALAAQIQCELIPRVGPRIDGLECAVLFRPAGYVSGDLFDVRRLDESRVGFFLADAVGHGVPAALFTLLIARSIRMVDDAGGVIEPAEVMAALNREMVERNVTGSRFATGVYGVMNVRTGEVVVAGAGHPAPIVVRRSGTERVTTDGPLLGIFDDAVFTQKSLTLKRAEALVLFSDGFESAFPRSAEDAYSLRLTNNDYVERLTEFARECCGGSFEESSERFGQTLDAQFGSLHQVDDLTALVLSPRLSVAASAAA